MLKKLVLALALLFAFSTVSFAADCPIHQHRSHVGCHHGFHHGHHKHHKHHRHGPKCHHHKHHRGMHKFGGHHGHQR